MATTSIADETKELDKDRAKYNKLYIMFLSEQMRTAYSLTTFRSV